MNTFTRILLAAGLAVIGQLASAQQLLDNFEATRLVDYPSPQGTLTVVANPGSNGTNTSATVGSFVRDGGQQYSTVSIQLKNNALFASVAAYVAGTKRISLKFRSAAPAGTAVQLVLQNRAKAIATPYAYPQGNFSGVFNATTTAAANTWETLTFTYAAASSDATVTANDIDQIAMLIAPGTNSAATYYFDDLTGPEVSTTTAPVVTDQLYDNFEGTRAVKYKGSYITSGGFKLDTLNQASGGINTSAHVMRYTRSNQQYDVLFLSPKGANLADVSPFLTNAKQMTMKVYSRAIGTVFQITLQDSTKARAGYPTGRHSEYQATTKTANAWETLTFSFSNRPDPSTGSTGLNEIVLLIAPGTFTPGKYYLDDWTGPRLTNYLATTRATETSSAAFAAPYPNPADGLVHLPYNLLKSSVVSLTLFDMMGRHVATVLDNQTRPAGEHSVDFNTANLAPGLYTCRLTVDGAPLTRVLSVE